MDIFKDTTESSTASLLEIDRFKAKILEIWSRMLEDVYSQNYIDGDKDNPSREEFIQANALKFSDEPEAETELDSLMDMLDGLLEDDEEHEDIKSDGKAPTYSKGNLKTHNEKGKVEATTYEFNKKTTKTPGDSHSRIKSSSYEGVQTGRPTKKKNAKVFKKYSPLIEQIKEEVRSLADRQRIGRRKMRFRL